MKDKYRKIRKQAQTLERTNTWRIWLCVAGSSQLKLAGPINTSKDLLVLSRELGDGMIV